MKAFAITDEQGSGEVIVFDVLVLVNREATRQSLKDNLPSRFVWFEDEIGTLYDPLRGPCPRFGPRANRG